MVRRTAALALAVALSTIGLAACAGDGPGEGSIVATTNILGDVAQQIVGEEAEVVVLMPDGADPHSFEISARDAATVESAALVVSNGLGLEEGVQNIVDAAADAGVPVLAVGEEIDTLEYREGSSVGQADPHFWTDPERMREAVQLIADQVIAQVPDVDAAAVQARAVEYEAELLRWTARCARSSTASRRTGASW